jgi:hypothetical protein
MMESSYENIGLAVMTVLEVVDIHVKAIAKKMFK